jgi:hypothetical protein
VRPVTEKEASQTPPSGGAVPGEEPEPDWAELIRRLRKDRGDRLRRIFATFDDEEAGPA